MISMIKQYENLLNCREYLRKNLHIFIDAFVEFYGEDKREEIEKKLKEPLYLAYRSPDSLKIILYDLEKKISEDIQTRAIRSSGTLFSAEDLFDKISFAYQNTIPLYQYHEFYELFKLGPEGREQQYRKDYYESLRRFLPELTEEEFDEMTRTQTVPSKIL